MVSLPFSYSLNLGLHAYMLYFSAYFLSASDSFDSLAAQSLISSTDLFLHREVVSILLCVSCCYYTAVII